MSKRPPSVHYWQKRAQLAESLLHVIYRDSYYDIPSSVRIRIRRFFRSKSALKEGPP